MIHFKDVLLRYGDRRLLDGVNFAIHKDDRIGLVGSNGAGKSTLLKILAGLEHFESGEIVMPKGMTVGYLPQEILGVGERTLYAEAEAAFSDVISLRRQLDAAGESLQSLPTDSEAYLQTLELIGQLEHALEDAEADKLRSRVEKVLHGLGFNPGDMDKRCAEFSGGWRMRIALAKLLLRSPSLLMLDEPTNHLDIESVVWLEQYLKSYRGAIILVSHDRRLLDSLTTRTLALVRGQAETYSGNYSFYERESRARKEQTERAAKNQARSIEKVERFIDRFRAKSSKAAQVQSRIKALDKIERIEVEEEEAEIAFRFPPPERGGRIVFRAEGIVKRYGEKTVLGGVSLQIERGERVAIAGMNGAGKSTLVRIMAGALPFDAGVRELGHNVTLSYFAQHQAEELDPSLTALAEAESAAPPGQERRARDLLGGFLFSGDDALKLVKVLSGGEKNRLALAKMLLKTFNFLILDEPTNHLDMRSKRVLQRAIEAYEGTLVIVSHDRDFIDPLVTKVIEVGHGGLRTFLGNVSDYAEKVAEEKRLGIAPAHGQGAPKPAAPAAEKTLSAKERRARSAQLLERLAPLRKRVNAAEALIEKLEKEKADLEGRMLDADFYKGPDSAASLRRYELLKAEIEAAYLEWSEASEQVETLKAQAEQ